MNYPSQLRVEPIAREAGRAGAGIRVGFLLLLAWSLSALGAEFSVREVEKNAPEELAPPIRERLQPVAVQIFRGGEAEPAFELWLARNLPLKEAPASTDHALRFVRETELLGALVVSRDRRDYRDDEMYKGTYTMRLGMQPQDGNHLGTSDFPFFGVLVPARLDRELEGIRTYKQLVKASSRETATDHPVIFSLRPAENDSSKLPAITKPADDHLAVRLAIPASVEGVTGQMSLVFDLVIEGVAQH